MRNKIFEKIPVTLPQRSGFDLSHETRGTAKPGILVPVMTREMEGHDSLSVNIGEQIQFPPFATDFYGRIKVYFESFFVPYRIIDGDYKTLYRASLAAVQEGGSASPDDGEVNPYFVGLNVYDGVRGSDDSVDSSALTLEMTADPSVGLIGPQTLLDYLGVKSWKPGNSAAAAIPLKLKNYHRLTAYHLIYQEYYMDSRLQNRPFHVYRSGSLSNDQRLRCTPSIATPVNNKNKYWLNDGPLGDGCYMTGLRARNYAKDYFTTATPDPQFGGEIGFEVDSNGRATISQVRQANALQMYVETHNRVGNHYDDLAFALTGIRPSDAAVDIPIYLGRQVYDVYNKSIMQTSSEQFNSDGTAPATVNPNAKNPYNSVGSKFANGQSLGSGHLCDFTATEGGIFMVLMSVAPDASYDSGTARQWDYDSIFDLPKPQLSGIGDQPIYKGELAAPTEILSGGSVVGYDPISHDEVFGYSQRFSEAKFMLDETHGLLNEYQSLSAFALKRHFDFTSDVELGLDFIRVPINALDEVSALSLHGLSLDSKDSYLGFYWYDIYFEVKLVSNLPAYSLPTLENMHGPSVMMDNGGRRF